MYFFNVISSFNINFDASIVITIELVSITEITDTFPLSNANLLKIDDEESSKDCNKKYFLQFIFLISI